MSKTNTFLTTPLCQRQRLTLSCYHCPDFCFILSVDLFTHIVMIFIKQNLLLTSSLCRVQWWDHWPDSGMIHARSPQMKPGQHCGLVFMNKERITIYTIYTISLYHYILYTRSSIRYTRLYVQEQTLTTSTRRSARQRRSPLPSWSSFWTRSSEMRGSTRFSTRSTTKRGWPLTSVATIFI